MSPRCAQSSYPYGDGFASCRLKARVAEIAFNHKLGTANQSMLFQTTPDTSGYLLLGFVMFGVLGFGFIVSLIARLRNLRRDAALIEELLEEMDES